MKRRLLFSASILVLTACAGPPPPPTQKVQVVPLAEGRKAQVVPADVVDPRQVPDMTHPKPFVDKRSEIEVLREANDSSKRTVKDGSFTRATLTYRWVPGEIYSVVATRNKVVNIKLFPSEGFLNYAFGDNRYFGLEPVWAGTRSGRAEQYGPGQTVIPVIAFEGGRCTDLTVYTTWRDIYIDICAKGNARAYNRSVEWWMPDEEREAFLAQAAAGAAQATPMNEATGVPVDRLDTRYKIDGPREWRPQDWQAMSDGKVTYVLPPADLPFRPVPTIRRKGEGNTPNYRTLPQKNGEGTYYEIDGVPGEVIFVNGRDDKFLAVTKAN